MTAPPLNSPIVDKYGILQTAWFLYFKGLFLGILGTGQPLTKIATPSNANAAAAGIVVGQMYTSTADPAPVYIRTV